MKNAGPMLQNNGDFFSGSAPHLETSTGVEKGEEASLIQHSRRPSLSSLQIPARSLERASSSVANTDSPLLTSLSSSRGGLSPRPHSTKAKPSIRSLPPQRSFKTKDDSQDCRKTILIDPDTLPSNHPVNRPSTSRSLSLNKVVFSLSTKATYSLPVKPTTKAGLATLHGRHLCSVLDSSKMDVKQPMARSLSVPVNGRTLV